ncbi:MAG TPA: CHAT domain-containing protein [Longimicrobium sp.]|jgi:hypothetical protein|nr:CHAT domain-containing protein [Longimicrobium sp.]
MARKTAVLVLAANPKDTPGLRLDYEVREIQSGLLRNRSRVFQIRQDWAVRPRDVRRAMLEHRPSIVHFCGHGSGEEGLILEDDGGTSQIVSTSAIAGLFALFSQQVKCVVLNACFSESQARAIAQHVECVVGMNRAITDHAAIEFAIGFYDAVAAGEEYDVAFRFGCNAIELAGLPGHLIPVLIRKEGDFVVPTVAHTSRIGRSAARTRSAGDELAVRSLRELNASGWSTADVMKRLEQLDYENVAGLDAASEGSVAQWEMIADSNPDGYAFLVDGGNEIVGYWHFEALPDDLFARTLEGEMEDCEITVDTITFLCAPGVLHLYFIIFAVEKPFRGFRANRLLLDAFMDRLEELATGGIYVRSISANAFTPEGVGMCKTLGMRYVRPHQRLGLIYHLDMKESELLLRSKPHLGAAIVAL